MSIQFPDAPFQGQSFVASNGVSYTYDNGGWIANSQSGLDDRYVNLDGDSMTGDLTVPSLNGGQLAGFRNQIINGDFAIDQRTNGTSTTLNGGGYGLDRWFMSAQARYSRNGSNGGSVPEEFGTAMRLEGPTTTTYTRQMVEFPFPGVAAQFSTGTTWTFSFWTTINSTTDVATSVVFADENATQTNAVQVSGGNKILSPTGVTVTSTDGTVFYQYSYTFTIAVKPLSTNKGMSVGIVALNNAGADWKIANAQLEPGPVATPFELRPIGIELFLCQRYYYAFSTGWFAPYWHGYDNNCSRGGRVIALPATMRVSPTGTASSLTWVSNAGVNLIGTYGGSPAVVANKNRASCYVDTTSQPSAGIQGQVNFDVVLNAEL